MQIFGDTINIKGGKYIILIREWILTQKLELFHANSFSECLILILMLYFHYFSLAIHCPKKDTGNKLN